MHHFKGDGIFTVTRLFAAFDTTSECSARLPWLTLSVSRAIFNAQIYWINCLSCHISPMNTVDACLHRKSGLSTKPEWISFIHLTLWADIIQANSAVGSVKCSHFSCEIYFHLRRMEMAKDEITVGRNETGWPRRWPGRSVENMNPGQKLNHVSFRLLAGLSHQSHGAIGINPICTAGPKQFILKD